MANTNNLTPFTSENASEMGRKGGKASGIARLRKKTMKEQMDLLLSKTANLDSIKNGDKLKEQLEILGIPVEEIDNQMLLVVSMYQTALVQGKNQVPAFIAVRDTVGDKPKDKIEFSKDIDETVQEIEDYLCNKK